MRQQADQFARPSLLKRFLALGLVLVVAVGIWLAGRVLWPRIVPHDYEVEGLTEANLAETDADLFPGLDGGVALTPEEMKGRNTWMIWTAGNADFWNWLAQYGYGTNDLLKTLDSRNRAQRFRTMGLINEPDFRTATKPDPRTGLWLDERTAPPEPVD